jgi:hypothetical protein
MDRGLFTDSFLVELYRREWYMVVAGRVGEVASNARQAALPKDTRWSLLGSRKGVSRVRHSEWDNISKYPNMEQKFC